MSCLALFGAKDRGKDRENIDKKGKGWKKPKFGEGVGAKNKNEYN